MKALSVVTIDVSFVKVPFQFLYASPAKKVWDC